MMAWSCCPLPALTDGQFDAWRQLVETRTGVDLSQHRSILETGLNRRARELGVSDFDAYFQQVSQWPGGMVEWQRLIDHILVKETSFFRQSAAFELVGNHLRERVQSARTLDLWSVGCATGEEAYGLAMVASDVVESSGSGGFVGVLATDICAEALRRARAGRFAARRLEAVPEALRRRYFNAVADGSHEILPGLRRRICWMQANLLETGRLPPLAMDVIFCQNVLVYFRRWRVRQVLDALAGRLKPGGLLVLGPGEGAHWQHPALTRVALPGVSAYLRRIES